MTLLRDVFSEENNRVILGRLSSTGGRFRRNRVPRVPASALFTGWSSPSQACAPAATAAGWKFLQSRALPRHVRPPLAPRVLKIHFGVVPCQGRLVVLADGLAGSVQSKSEKRRSGRGDEAGEPGSPFIPPPHVGGYGRLHGYGLGVTELLLKEF